MDVRELESVVAVYTNKSFSEAAYQTSFSVSVISKHVKRVEQELGVVLFNRRTHDSAQILTEQGEQLMPAIIKAVDNLNFIRHLAGTMKQETKSLRIGGMSMMFAGVFDEILMDFCMKYSDIVVDTVFRDSPELLRGLDSGELDGVFALYTGLKDVEAKKRADNAVSGDIRSILINRTTDLSIAVSDKHPLAGRKSIDLRLMADEIFLFNAVQEKTPERTARVTSLTGRDPERVKKRFMDYKNYNTAFAIVASGAAVMPKVVTRPMAYPGVVLIPVEGWDDYSEYTFLYNKNNRDGAFLKFKKCVEEHRTD